MIPILLFGAVSGVALGSIAFSYVILLRARTLIAAAEKQSAATLQQNEATLEAIRERIETLSGQINDLRREPAVQGRFRPGFNLSKRSQALRMHRRGDPPEQIASALDIPLQELDLLVKVHRIVMSSF